ncbi:Polyphosphate kinase [Fulvivirga imtechensis AK7]|uniref:Polyphosphate kinase n=1 Tax=Fulvivirga imtechensis AK7 TaxID=1237149 RepID=L8JUN7_9BACT|nr:polyphosphate kinase 1 [Fulvivirga imtechensis]ELR72505.1 Polyphosphate kinase [Fulvivirga imtechensis AK7]
MIVPEKIRKQIEESDYISRDLSWLKFNDRVLDQAKDPGKSIIERLKFLAITESNLDEFCTIRVGSLYNYLDYKKQRFDYSGLREIPFRKVLFAKTKQFSRHQHNLFINELTPLFEENGFIITNYKDLRSDEKANVNHYFETTIYPMLTPMVYDNYHPFPILNTNRLVLGVVTKTDESHTDYKKLSFIQIPSNLPRFYEVEREDIVCFISIEEIIKHNVEHLFRNVQVLSITLFRIIRNGDFTLEESDDIEANFLEELKKKLKTRRTGRVVRLEVTGRPDNWMMNVLKERWDIDDDNIFKIKKRSLLDFTGLTQIVNHPLFRDLRTEMPSPVPPLSYPEIKDDNILDVLRERDVLLHHPYNSIEPVLELLERAAEDPGVLAIKITIYRVARDSRVTSALLKAAENGKHVSVLFEVKARFDEENNLREAQRLQKAGCFVIYGVSSFKTHTKLMLIVRKEGEKVTRYVHLSSGNYNESTSKLYTDLGLLTTNEVYAHDVSEFFNVLTGHSLPNVYLNLITAPKDMRPQLIKLIRNEAENARKGLPSGIVIKINSLQDKESIDEMYAASQAGVPIKLIVRGMCCLRPGRKGLSENIQVLSIVGHYLEHSRIYYFHNQGNSKVYIGSADMMVRSFERRLESLFMITDDLLKHQLINILQYNLKDNVNSYVMREDGTYQRKHPNGQPEFNIHREFYNVTKDNLEALDLSFEVEPKMEEEIIDEPVKELKASGS